MMSYEDTIKYLYSLQDFGIKLGLKNIGALLKKLSSPQETYSTVHIAGTNGKGSTAAAIESALIKGGYNVGLYTSPHLIDFKERIRVNRYEIDEESVVEITGLLREKKEELKVNCEITFFEYVTALAFYYFMQKKVDIAIIEVGMGGRLDATNVLTPLTSVITSISMEHQQYLGETIEEIAGEKAGIIKEGVPVISGVQNEQAKAVIKRAAESKNAKLYEIRKDFDFTKLGSNETFDYNGINKTYKGVKKRLLGEHQYTNFSAALAALETIADRGFPVDEENIRKGLGSVRWPGRFEVVSDDPLIILDGAHNDESMEFAVNTLKENYPDRKVISIVGVMKDKDAAGIAKRISDVSNTIILTRPEINRAAAADELAAFFDKKEDVVKTPSVKDALDYAEGLCAEDSLIFVSGSLFTVGDAKKYLQKCKDLRAKKPQGK
jgi:dihydrofolate synthase/folylpolyglutamate synthase